jgi:hypothetical protein
MPTTADGRFGPEELDVITRHLEDAFDGVESLRYRLEQLDESKHDVTDEARLDTETVGRLFLALDWFETRGESIVREAREALEVLPVTSKLQEVPQGA